MDGFSNSTDLDQGSNQPSGMGQSMRVVIQRVSSAQVTSAGKLLGEIGPGLCLLVGFGPGDTPEHADWVAAKIAGLRLFPDDSGKMNRSVMESGGGVLVVSQFTLYADVARGRRPSFVGAAPPELALSLYRHFLVSLRRFELAVAAGEFGAMMQVSLTNDGPVTIILEH